MTTYKTSLQEIKRGHFVAVLTATSNTGEQQRIGVVHEFTGRKADAEAWFKKLPSTFEKIDVAGTIAHRAGKTRDGARATLATWAAKLTASADPTYGMSWSNAAFEAVATIHVVEHVIAGIEKTTAKTVLDDLQSQVLRGAQSVVNRSASSTSNLVDDHILTVFAKVVEKFKQLIEWAENKAEDVKTTQAFWGVDFEPINRVLEFGGLV